VVGPQLDVELLQPLPDLGLLLLLFSVGLEFGPDRLAALSGRALQSGVWDAVALPIGVLLGLALGLDLHAALLLGSAIYVSSSAVIAKLIIDLRRAAYPESEVVLGVLVFEDVVIAVVLALASGQGGVLTVVGSGVLIVAYLLAARLLAPRLARFVAAASGELLILVGIAFMVGTAELFLAVGSSEGVGAFLAGVLAASLHVRDRLEELFVPVRDLAAALFFLTVGATARATLAEIGGLAIALALLAPLLKLPLNYLSGAAGGLGQRGRLLTAVYLVPRGEFTLVLAGIALDNGATFVGQVAVLMVLVTIPVGALLIQIGPHLTRGMTGRRLHPRLRTVRPTGGSETVRDTSVIK
jgi:CPA2 family monovalent cation:H+ antiporter-2